MVIFHCKLLVHQRVYQHQPDPSWESRSGSPKMVLWNLSPTVPSEPSLSGSSEQGQGIRGLVGFWNWPDHSAKMDMKSQWSRKKKSFWYIKQQKDEHDEHWKRANFKTYDDRIWYNDESNIIWWLSENWNLIESHRGCALDELSFLCFECFANKAWDFSRAKATHGHGGLKCNSNAMNSTMKNRALAYSSYGAIVSCIL